MILCGRYHEASFVARRPGLVEGGAPTKYIQILSEGFVGKKVTPLPQLLKKTRQ